MAAQKPLALLIPGLDGTGRLYEPQIPALQERYRVRCWWFRSRPRFDFGALVGELMEGTSAEEAGSITVVGESFGGTVAIQYALACPDRVRKLVLINTFPEYRGRIRIRLACRLCHLLRLPYVQGIKDFVAERILRMEGVAAAERRHYLEVVRLIDLDAYRRRLELVRDVRLRDRLPEIRVPTLICASGRDKVVPSVREARYMAEHIPGARLHEFPRAGHALILTPGFSLADYL